MVEITIEVGGVNSLGNGFGNLGGIRPRYCWSDILGLDLAVICIVITICHARTEWDFTGLRKVLIKLGLCG